MISVFPPDNPLDSIELVNSFSKREIKYVFHDIDGTHSLIRDWVPVMTLVTGAVAAYGMFPGAPAEAAAAIAQQYFVDPEKLRGTFFELLQFFLSFAGIFKAFFALPDSLNDLFVQFSRFAVDPAAHPQCPLHLSKCG